MSVSDEIKLNGQGNKGVPGNLWHRNEGREKSFKMKFLTQRWKEQQIETETNLFDFYKCKQRYWNSRNN